MKLHITPVMNAAQTLRMMSWPLVSLLIKLLEELNERIPASGNPLKYHRQLVVHVCKTTKVFDVLHGFVADDKFSTLAEFHLGHIKTYQIDRSAEVDAAVIDMEVTTLIALLRSLNLARDIEQRYKPLVDPADLTPEELSALPARVRDYKRSATGDRRTAIGQTADPVPA
jgi:hypothetical protein